MKRTVLSMLCALFSFAIFGQQTKVSASIIEAKSNLTLSGKKVDAISNDSTASNKRNDKLITEFAAKRYAEIVNSHNKVFDLVKDGGAKTDGTGDVAGIINDAFAHGYLKIDISGGDFLFTKSVKLVNGCSIVGIGGEGTRLVTTMDSAFFVASRSKGGNGSTITGVTFVGDYTGGIDGTSTKTKQDGVYLDSANAVLVTNVRANNLGGFMFHAKKNSLPISGYVRWATDASIVTDNIIKDSHGAIYLDSLSEYCVISNNVASNNVFSIKHTMAANNIITGNDFGGNHFGFWSEGGLGNILHAPCSNTSFNHCDVPCHITDAPTGMYFDNCTFYTDRDSILIKNSSYIRFSGGFFTVNNTYEPGAKIRIENCTNCSFSDVDEVFGFNSQWSITGEVPTFFINGKNSTKAFTIVDKKNNKEFSIKNVNGVVSLFGMDSLQFKSLPSLSSPVDSMMVVNSITGTVGKRSIPTGGGSSSVVAFTTITGNYTATSTDHVIWVNAGGSLVTISLPSASANPGKEYRVCRYDITSTGTISLYPPSGNLIGADGNPFGYCNVPNYWDGKVSLVMVSDGSYWRFSGY